MTATYIVSNHPKNIGYIKVALHYLYSKDWQYILSGKELNDLLNDLHECLSDAFEEIV